MQSSPWKTLGVDFLNTSRGLRLIFALGHAQSKLKLGTIYVG